MLVGSYDGWLVAASLLMAMLTSYTALDMAGRCTVSNMSIEFGARGGIVAADDTTSLAVLQHALDWFEKWLK